MGRRPHVHQAGWVAVGGPGQFAGSALLLPDQLRNFIRFTNTPRHEAIRTVTFNPARSIVMDDFFGLIVPGRSADLVAWDDDLNVRHVWRAGCRVGNPQSLAEVALNRHDS